ncbi:unnamed protein product [Mytilus coruscus]|uniref:Uncharacterized protein n=1 Tax=Mytilus coruscus TaxID=42192 RepID=A0A6J8CC44_MYTCO|nr:unnamed protein product [Mytilus coruscus]
MAQELILMSRERYERLVNQPQTTNQTDFGKTERLKNDHEEQPVTNFMPMIDRSVPKKFKKHAADLYRFVLAQDKNVVNHNEQGELIRNGETMTGSHIVDLIHYIVSTRHRKRPIGSKEFQDLLRKMNVPKRLIAERRKKSFTQTEGLFVKGRGGETSYLARHTKKNRFVG